MEGKTLLYAIDLANAIRQTGGFEKVDDLVPGIPGDSENCVLAQTFNCNCRVEGKMNPAYITNLDRDYANPDALGKWFAWFDEEQYAIALAGELDEKVYHWQLPPDDQYFGAKFTPVHSWGVRLPVEVGEIAAAFDEGGLDDKYYANPN